MLKSFEELLKLAQEKGPKRLSVAVAQDRDVLSAVKTTSELNIIEPILVGDKAKIEEISREIDFDLSGVEIIDEKDGVSAARRATELVSSGQADILMKGLIDTSIIMKQVLDKEIGLRTSKIISHVAVFDVETYHKVLLLTDAAMNISPSLEEKKQITENAVELAHALGIENPKMSEWEKLAKSGGITSVDQLTPEIIEMVRKKGDYFTRKGWKVLDDAEFEGYKQAILYDLKHVAKVGDVPIVISKDLFWEEPDWTKAK